ncbi:MAG: caspase family protein, partial [Reyranella sp.]|nr:caspase family protein [Reyranella sp.]
MKKIALLIGIDAYPRMTPLSSCALDVDGLATILQMREYAFDVRQLVEGSATRSAVLDALRHIATERPDVFLFYFSGHGSSDRMLGASLVLFDWSRDRPGLSMDELGRNLDGLAEAGTNVVATLDCCRAGALPVELGGINRREFEVSVPNKPISRCILAACRPEGYALAGRPGNKSAFTEQFCDALLGAAADDRGEVTAGRVCDYISAKLEQAGEPAPIFKLDVEHRIVLASDLTPVVAAETEGQVSTSVSRQFARMLDNFAQRHAPSIMSVGQPGFAAACDALDLIVEWSRKQQRAYPFLSDHLDFRQAQDVLNSNRARLANIQVGAEIRYMKGYAHVIERVGSGGFGSVYKVQVKDGSHAGQLRAVKVYHPNELANEEKVSRFSRGYNAMKRLDWPTIVRVHEHMECPLGFSMDFIDGPNLKGFVSARMWDDDYYEVALRVMILIADAIQHAHQRSVLHRDIKPENIVVNMLDGEAIPYLTDFDLAWMSTASAMTRTAMGNAFYAPPEQFAHPDSFQAREPTVDVYAFGQLCYFVLTGADPIPMGFDTNVEELGARIERYVSGLARDRWLRFYSDCTRLRPKERLQDFEVVRDGLDEIEGFFRTQSDNTRIDSLTFIGELASRLGQRANRHMSSDAFLSTTGRTGGLLRIIEHNS